MFALKKTSWPAGGKRNVTGLGGAARQQCSIVLLPPSRPPPPGKGGLENGSASGYMGQSALNPTSVHKGRIL
jgi:hypothetical protein